MFVSVEQAALAARHVNGDWSEISQILPVGDRFIPNWLPPLGEDSAYGTI